MLTSHRLDAWVLPASPEFRPDPQRLDTLLADWAAQGIVPNTARIGEVGAKQVFAGGFRQLQIHAPESVRFVANQVGGFRVFCGGTNLTHAFTQAMGRWRSGGERTLACPGCQASHPLETLEFRPNAGFYRFALAFSDIGQAGLLPEANKEMLALLGELTVVYRRIG
jgi:hypothetical protein